MAIFYVVLYAIVNMFFYFTYLKKTKFDFSPGFIVVGFYTIVAVLGIPAYNMLPKDDFFYRYDFTNVTFLPYVLLFVATYFLWKPIFSFKEKIIKTPLNISLKKVEWLSYLYIALAFFSIFLYYRLIRSMSIEDMAMIRVDVYQGEQQLAYGNLFERAALSFTSRLNTLMTVVFFLLLAKYRDYFSKVFFILLGIAIILPIIGDAARTVSRGVVISLIIQLALGFSFFAQFYTKKIKKLLFLCAIFVLIGILIYSLIVTEARFGDGDTGFSSLICYWGQPPIVFNSQVMEVTDFGWGRRLFLPIADYLGFAPKTFLAEQGRAYNPCFITNIGGMYLDFSLLGVCLLVILIPYLINKFLRNQKTINMGTLYLMMFYCLYVQHGALVTKSGYIEDILIALILYFIFKKITESKRMKQ